MTIANLIERRDMRSQKSYIERIVELGRNSNTQIVASTHNPSLYEAAENSGWYIAELDDN